MTLKYFCDRCDKISEKNNFSIHIQRYPRTQLKDTNLDLCINCYNDFQKFMKVKNNKK